MADSRADSSLKTILHLDMNSYFATAEQQANPYLRGLPVGIIKAAGRGCIIAASVEAKKFGVKTGTTVWEAKKKCPQIVLVPSDMEKYFSLTQKLIGIVRDYTPKVEIFSIDEVFLDMTESQNLFSGGVFEAALEIKWRMKQEMGEWMRCSIGVGSNRLRAKLASEMQKPDGLTFLTETDYLEKTAKVKVEEVCGIGRARTRWLAERGIYTLGEARKLELPEEIRKLVWLEAEAELIGVEDLNPAKSVSRTYTTYRELREKEAILRLVRNLCEEAAAKLREMEMGGRTISLFMTANRSEERFWARKTLHSPLADGLMIFQLLWKEFCLRPISGVRFAGVGVSNLEWNKQTQIWTNREGLLQAVDKVNERYGLFTVYPASLLGKDANNRQVELIRPEVTGFMGDKWYRFGGRKRT